MRRGYSGATFRLCMTRGEIGSYLGLSLETVSRHFSALGRDGLIEVRMRDISILDVQGLERILDAGGASRAPRAMRPPASRGEACVVRRCG